MNKFQCDKISDFLEQMKGQSIDNYIVAGLNSSMIDNGKVRLFSASRNQRQEITPHSHTYDLLSIVLRGKVENFMWIEADDDTSGESFLLSEIVKTKEFGEYDKKEVDVSNYYSLKSSYIAGDIYHINEGEIHSIKFSKDAIVLLFESEEKLNCSEVLEPFVDGELIPTLIKEDWMFKSN